MNNFTAAGFWSGFEDIARRHAPFEAAVFKTPIHGNEGYLSISGDMQHPFSLVAVLTTSKSLATDPDNTSLRAEIKTNSTTGIRAINDLASARTALWTRSGACAWPHSGKSDAKIELRWIGANLHSEVFRSLHYQWLVAAFTDLRNSFEGDLMRKVATR